MEKNDNDHRVLVPILVLDECQKTSTGAQHLPPGPQAQPEVPESPQESAKPGDRGSSAYVLLLFATFSPHSHTFIVFYYLSCFSHVFTHVHILVICFERF